MEALCSMPDGPLSHVLKCLKPSDIFRLSTVCSTLKQKVCSRSEYVLYDALPSVVRARCAFVETRSLGSRECSREDHTCSSPLRPVNNCNHRSPGHVYKSLRCLDVTGLWAVVGTYANGTKYEYEMNLWTMGSRHGSRELELFIGGEVDWKADQKMTIVGKVDADIILLNEMVCTRSPVPSFPFDIMNVCSATLALDGCSMCGVWFQQVVKENEFPGPSHHKYQIVSSGTFEATKIRSPETGWSAPPNSRQGWAQESVDDEDTVSAEIPSPPLESRQTGGGEECELPQRPPVIDGFEEGEQQSTGVAAYRRSSDYVFTVPKSPDFGFYPANMGSDSETLNFI